MRGDLAGYLEARISSRMESERRLDRAGRLIHARTGKTESGQIHEKRAGSATHIQHSTWFHAAHVVEDSGAPENMGDTRYPGNGSIEWPEHGTKFVH
jgi:hypothetical protein